MMPVNLSGIFFLGSFVGGVRKERNKIIFDGKFSFLDRLIVYVFWHLVDQVSVRDSDEDNWDSLWGIVL